MFDVARVLKTEDAGAAPFAREAGLQINGSRWASRCFRKKSVGSRNCVPNVKCAGE